MGVAHFSLISGPEGPPWILIMLEFIHLEEKKRLLCIPKAGEGGWDVISGPHLSEQNKGNSTEVDWSVASMLERMKVEDKHSGELTYGIEPAFAPFFFVILDSAQVAQPKSPGGWRKGKVATKIGQSEGKAQTKLLIHLPLSTAILPIQWQEKFFSSPPYTRYTFNSLEASVKGETPSSWSFLPYVPVLASLHSTMEFI